MKKGTPIYYYSKDGDSFPGVVLDTRKKVKIRINHFDGNKEIWVNEASVEKQEHWTNKL